jgi:hypothetical protein
VRKGRYDLSSSLIVSELRLRVSENRVLRRMFGPEGKDVRGWRKSHNEERHEIFEVFLTIRAKNERGIYEGESNENRKT